MPKLGMEPIRRAALVKATIDEIGANGSLDVTVSQIAKRAGMSSALAHHYFGGKEQIFLAAMRHTLSVYAAEVRGALIMADTPRERLEAIIRAGFGTSNFRREVIAAWLNFYVLAQTSSEAKRLLTIYQRRLHANLMFNLRPLLGDDAQDAAYRIGGLIDGIYLREALTITKTSSKAATKHVLAALDLELGKTK
ncbi:MULTISPECIES: transcriptional regulator BetI [Marivivens]|jgi:TetR/AcrR family transcriptional repressor of bet genes|uniref:choline-binding transcriptional repressor BetI n=1 Tax=Marivivens TaxID=1759396 RepID=UPI000AC20DCB|nr:MULTISPECIES: transcriptional regulator BetI [Marivivens]MCL7406209.1 transcriptional regulator BetI [Marivivens geojensis]MCL7407826.1 transcriptional regulator BetI [Marivivens donghaensis]MDN3704195.1 transcriptional regulator BetI [Marivivens donghaensis]NBX09218.1 transcriptional regulator BetI [Marivivens sp.]